ncbi:MAG: proprotein convertase P-domain-containing protein [Sedimentisphaerales bacterium]
MCKKFVLLACFVAMLGLVGAKPALGAALWEGRIASQNDDAEESITDGGAIDLGSSDLEMPYENAGQDNNQIIGLRFVDVAIPKGAVIADAYVEFTCDETKDGTLPVSLVIDGQLDPDAGAFTDAVNDISSRPPTAAQVVWVPAEWTTEGQKDQTVNIASIIQEIINQEGWAEGNALVLFVRDDAANPSQGTRGAESYSDSANAPLLHIAVADSVDIRVADGADDAEEHLDDGDMDITSSDLELPYEDAGDPATDEQAVGLRFLDVPMDQGGKVLSAYIEIEVDKVDKEGSQAPVNLVIEGELTPNAAPFEEVAGNISARATTATKVKWSVPEWTEQDAKFQSPDVSAVIQEIVDQEGWEAGNAIVLIVRDDKDNPSTGLREAESYDGEIEAAPLLHITGALAIVRTASEPVPADGAVGVSAIPALSTFVSADVPKAIPDWGWNTQKNADGEVTSTLSVPDSVTIKDLNVELDITMPGGSDADLNAYLTSPDGKQVKLFDDVGVYTSNFTNTILDDEGSTSVTNGKGPFTGIYKPEGKLSDFNGRDTEGTWKLKIVDDWPGGPGTLNSWRVVVENPIMVSWLPGFDAASQDVYLSSSFADVNDNVALIGTVPGDAGAIDVGSLEIGTTYYWRVDTIASDGALHVGAIWSFSTPIGNVELNQRIANGDDDLEERLDRDGELDIGSSDLEMPYEDEGQGDLQIIGLRFVNVDVPVGASIIESYLEFEVDETKGGTEPVNVIIDAQLSPDAEPFVDEPYNVSNRTFTETVVPWSIPEWTVTDEKFQTPDITALIEEVINQEGWAAGNAVVFSIQDDPCNPSLGIRCAESYNGEPSAAPLLHVAGVTEAAMNPSPANGAVDVVQQTILSWSPGFTGMSRDVYFGTSSNPPKLARTTGTTYDVGKLAVSTTYYWKIDEYDVNGKKHPGPVWSFTTVIGEATNPYPANNATAVPIDVVLSWTPGGTAVSHDGYLGTTDPPPFLGNTTENSFDTMEIGGLEPGTTYYWRLDAVEADGTVHVGEVWSFTTIALTASDPSPADGATDVATDVELSWTPGLDAKLHAVYFGDDPDTVANADGAAPMPFTTFNPGPLEAGKTYYWRVDEVNPPTTTKGDVWSFATAEPEPAL